jgi:transposase InsO family protein
MTWEPVDMLTLRQEFVALALQPGVNRRALCARFGISPKTGYKWINRHAQEGHGGLADRSRRPTESPLRTVEQSEALVLNLREEHPTWGGRKIHRRLLDLGHAQVPTPSTVTRILQRHGCIDPAASERATPWLRFEHAAPNDLWQIDFKGHFETDEGTCHPLTVLDDHSRYNIVLQGCATPNGAHVRQALIGAFERFGMPLRMNADNGPPWGSSSRHEHGITTLTIWLIELGIWISHSRPMHPQTNGKEERFHRTLKEDVLQGRRYRTLDDAQQAFDEWRQIYNQQRPHEAIGLATPVTRYLPSKRAYCGQMPVIVYPPDDLVLTVGRKGAIKVQGRAFLVSTALQGHRIGVRAAPDNDGQYDLYFAHQKFGRIDLRSPANRV